MGTVASTFSSPPPGTDDLPPFPGESSGPDSLNRKGIAGRLRGLEQHVGFFHGAASGDVDQRWRPGHRGDEQLRSRNVPAAE